MLKKSIFFILLFVFCFSSISYAEQNQFSQNVSSYVYGGLSASKFDIDVLGINLDTKYKWGATIGVLAEYSFNDIFSFDIGLSYVGKGYKLEAAGEESDGTVHYLEFPLYAKAYLPLKDLQFKPFVLAGPYMSFKISTSGDIESDAIKTFDYGLVVGAGFLYKDFFFQLTYDWGLKDIEDVGGDTSSLVDMKNRTFLFTIGYRFKAF